MSAHALPRGGRRAVGTWLRSRPVALVAGPVGSVVLFTAVLVITHLPTVYGLTLSNDYVHEVEHGIYLLTALLMWAPLLGADPLPHRAGPRGQLACTAACMAPMALIALWLGTAAHPIYDHYLQTTATAALHDQRAAATILWAACLPAFAVPLLRRARIPEGHRLRQQVSPR